MLAEEKPWENQQWLLIIEHIDTLNCHTVFDKYKEQFNQLETAVTWSKSNLNIMNIY